MSAEDFRPVTPSKPCEICEKPDWCRHSEDGAHECHRVHGSSVNGFIRTATTDAGYSIYRTPEERTRDHSLRKRPCPSRNSDSMIDLAAEVKKFQSAISLERKATIARDLGVNVSALESICIGRADERDLKRLRASGSGWQGNYPPVALSFPECDATGAVIGICFRTDDGRKGSPSGKVGAKRGLVISSTLPERPDPVLAVEGSTDVAACETLKIAAIGRPSNTAGGNLIAELLEKRSVLVVGENDQKPAGMWPGCDGAKNLAKELASTWKRPVSWTLPPEGHKDVRAYLNHVIADGLDVEDEVACADAGRRLVEGLIASAIELQPPKADSKSERGARETVVSLCLEAGDHLFHDDENRGFVFVRGRGKTRTFSVRSCEYQLLIASRYYHATGSGLPSAAKSEAIVTLEALAVHDGPEEQVFIRCGEHEGKVVIDPCDQRGRVIVIDKNDWEVVDESPIRFRSTRGMLALPPPVHGGSINDLRQFINVSSENDFVLVCAFILGCFNPCGPFLIVLLNGEPGSAKSTCCRIIRALVDPNKAPLRSEPKDNRDLAIAANNSWMIGLDNMSHVSKRLSNALCRLATGGGFATRELYTNDDEIIFDAKRPIMINGIGDIADQGDLLDRAARLTLPTIPEDRRQTEKAFWSAFEKKRPAILGAFLDAVSMALRNQSDMRFTKLPRMADIATWVAAAEPACPWPAGSFIDAFDGQRRDADELVIEASRIANAIRDWVEQCGEIEGTATQILERLSANLDEKAQKRSGWPKGASAFGTKLREVAPNLRRLGIEVEFDRNPATRIITIRKM